MVDSQREPRLSTCCDPARQTTALRHELCGGWYCTCLCHDTPPNEPEDLSQLENVEWRAVGRAVYAGERLLYHGNVPPTPVAKQQMLAFIQQATLKARSDYAKMRAVVLAARAEVAAPGEEG